MRRSLTALVLLTALLLLAAPALAGGWATVRLDEPPTDLLTGQPWEFGFMVLQHDVTPNSDVTPVVRAVHLATGEKVTATARQDGPTGHFVAELTLPEAGEWSWTITPDPFAETSFPALVARDQPKGVASGSPARLITRACANPDATAQVLFRFLCRAELPAAGPAAPGATETISMTDDWRFQPARLDIAPGTTVTWINRSATVHAVALDDPRHTASGLIEPGQTFSVTFDTPGVFSYHCSPHPGMEGTIHVTAG